MLRKSMAVAGVVVLFILILLPFLSRMVESVRFEVGSGQTRCIGEDIKINSTTVGYYSIVNPNEGQPLPEHHKIYVRLLSWKGNNIYHSADAIESGQFTFQAVEDGTYLTCFTLLDHQPPVNTSVEFDWKSGVAAKSLFNVVKKGSVDAMQLELTKLEYTIASIHGEMFYLRQREQEIEELNRNTNSILGFLSLVSLFLCLSVACLQLWHLKSFFEKKKII